MDLPSLTTLRQFLPISFIHTRPSQGGVMLSSGIIDLAIGLTFVFGVTAALSSVVTELISRFLGLRGAYLLSGLRALLDNAAVTTNLKQANAVYGDVKKLIADPAASASIPLSATGALLGGPILDSQGMAGQIKDRA